MADGNGGPDRRKMRLAAVAFAVVLGGCGGGEEPEADTTPTATAAEPAPTTTATTTRSEAPPPKGEPTVPAETPPGDPRENALEREASRTVRDYVGALDARDAERVCALLAPGVLDMVELPEPRGDCAASLAASIGYRDPRGLPVWEGAQAAGVKVAELTREGTAAKVVATVVTTFADREEASVEDDIVYVKRHGGRWLIAKPSATLYRAVGISDIPLTVLSPPSG